MRVGLALALLLVLALAQAATARAYSDPAVFAQPALRGGGEGRFFTGSPADGYTCAACHRGGVTPGLTIYGLPEVLDPGTAYVITLRWTQPELSHAMQLELLTERGTTPEVSIAPEATLSYLSRCESALDGDPAVYTVDLPGRRVLGVRDCGATELSFTLVAPETDRVYLTGSLVRSDSTGSAEGDGVLDLKQTLYRRGAELEPGGGCAVGHTPTGRSRDALTLLFVLGLARWLRRARREAVLLGALVLAGCYQAEQSADYELFDAGAGSDAHVAGGLDAGNAPDAAAGPRLMFRVQTMAFGGKYAPRNIGAIWVERAEGGYVKTLERWAGTRAMYLRNWQRAAAGDLTDAITSATLPEHRVHELRWDFTDVAGAVVPDGNYKLGLETTDRDATGAVHYVPFVKGPAGPQPTPVPSAHFVDMTLTIESADGLQTP